MNFSSLKFLLVTFALALSCSVQSADVQTQAPPALSVSHLQVAESTPIDRLIHKIYVNSPLNTTLLRKALVDANPKVITGNPQQRVKAGTTLVIPDHAELVRASLSPFVVQEASDRPTYASDNSTRKQWVRFP